MFKLWTSPCISCSDLPKNQMGFFNFVCLPFYTACGRAWPESEAVGAASCQANFDVWQQRAHAQQSVASPVAASCDGGGASSSGPIYVSVAGDGG